LQAATGTSPASCRISPSRRPHRPTLLGRRHATSALRLRRPRRHAARHLRRRPRRRRPVVHVPQPQPQPQPRTTRRRAVLGPCARTSATAGVGRTAVSTSPRIATGAPARSRVAWPCARPTHGAAGLNIFTAGARAHASSRILPLHHPRMPGRRATSGATSVRGDRSINTV